MKIAARGFTLIELLVVIAIIGILASVGVVSFSTAQAKARDSERKSELKQTQTALELYKSNTQGSVSYPATLQLLVDGGYLKTPVITGPKSGESYSSAPTGTGDVGYALCATLENTSDPNIIQNPCPAGATGNYGFTNP